MIGWLRRWWRRRRYRLRADKDLLDLLDGFSDGIGTLGTELTIDNIAKAREYLQHADFARYDELGEELGR